MGGTLGVVADDEAVAHHAVVDAHLLHAQVVRDEAVAALSGEGGLRLYLIGAELLADDVVPAATLEVATVVRGAKSTV